jgi:hypothetical protein
MVFPARTWFSNWFGHLLDLVQIVAEDLDADHGPHAGGQHVDAVNDGLRPDVGPARHPHHAVHFLEQVVLGLPPQKQVR